MIAGQTARSTALHRSRAADAPHYVYRCFDADGRLLYVGCTSNVARRMASHQGASSQPASVWLRACMTRHKVSGPFANWATAREVERAAITVEQPLFNMQDRGPARWMLLDAIAEYLIEHGHADLARDTACTCWRETLTAGGHDPWCVAHREPVTA